MLQLTPRLSVQIRTSSPTIRQIQPQMIRVRVEAPCHRSNLFQPNPTKFETHLAHQISDGRLMRIHPIKCLIDGDYYQVINPPSLHSLAVNELPCHIRCKSVSSTSAARQSRIASRDVRRNCPSVGAYCVENANGLQWFRLEVRMPGLSGRQYLAGCMVS
jgi:hypothetical protein